MSQLESSILVKKAVVPGGYANNCFLNIKHGKIHSITKNGAFSNVLKDYSHLTAIPGFIDIHTHGYYGIDATYSSVDDIHRWSSMLAKRGVTSFIPTCVSLPFEQTAEFIERIKLASTTQGPDEARIIGTRSEGPYISREKKGAHNPMYIRDPDINEIEKFVEASGDFPFIIDMAPELTGFQESAKYLVRNNKIVSIGHSAASYSDAMSGIGGGAKLMTHFFNAMSPMKHREVGMVGAGFLTDSIYLEIVADLRHVSEEAIRILFKIRDVDHIIGITDSLSIGGTTTLNTQLGGMEIVVRDGVAWVRNSDTIAGSVLTMDAAFRNLHRLVPDLAGLAKIFSTNAAKALNLKSTGLIDAGMGADINFIDDEMNVKETMIRGNLLGSKS